MLQIATYRLPEEQAEANDFLAKNKPEGTISFNTDTVFIVYDNGELAPTHKAAEIREYIAAAEAALMQQEISRAVLKMEADRAVNEKASVWEEKNARVDAQDDAIAAQRAKIEFLKGRLADELNLADQLSKLAAKE